MFKVTMKIDGMSCGMCEAHVNDAVRNALPAKKLKSSFKRGTTEFLTEEKPSEDELRKVIDATGYELKECRIEPAEDRKKLFGFL